MVDIVALHVRVKQARSTQTVLNMYVFGKQATHKVQVMPVPTGGT